jgi:hypothetical protein
MGSLSGTAKTNFFVTQGHLKGYSSDTKPVLTGRRSTSAALTGYSTGTCRGTRGSIQGYARGTHRDGAQVNFFGTVRLCQALLPLLRASRGRVVNIGSIGARMPSAFGSAYAGGTHHATSTRHSPHTARLLRGEHRVDGAW